MKQVKHILIFIFAIFISFISIENVFANTATCYYHSTSIRSQEERAAAWVTFTGDGTTPTSGNVTTRLYDYETVKGTAKVKNLTQEWYGADAFDELNIDKIKRNWKNCPDYLWIRPKMQGRNAGRFGGAAISDDKSELYDICGETDREDLCDSESDVLELISPSEFWDLSQCDPNKDECEVGEQITLVCDFNEEGKLDADGYRQVSLFGDPNHRGNGTDEDPPSTAYLIKQAMNILRIAGVAIAITLGTVDIAKAVIASKEDEMKKAQKTFVKRIIACVVIFLVPTFINIVIKMSYTSWQNQYYQACTVEEIGLSNN